MSAPLRFGIVGCGAIAPTHSKALASLAPEAQLAACCDVLPAAAEKFASVARCRALPWADLLRSPEVDAVILCTPSGMHAAQAVEVLQAGKHVLIEKPMDVTAEACDRLIAAQKTAGRQVGIISQHRFDPASRRVRALLDEGALGRVFGVEARIPWYRTQAYYDSGDWRGTRALDGGGALINQGIHTLDLMLWFGGPVRSVYARARTAVHERIEVEDHLCATIEFESGAIGSLLASTAAYPGFPCRVEVFGTSGTALLEGDEIHTIALHGRPVETGQALAGAVNVAAGGTKGATESSAADALGERWVWGDAHRAQLVDFIHACRADRAPAVGVQDGRRSVAVIEAIYRSAASGRPESPA